MERKRVSSGSPYKEIIGFFPRGARRSLCCRRRNSAHRHRRQNGRTR